MRFLATALLLLAASLPANAICVVSAGHGREESLQQARTVFVATITKAELDPDYRELAQDQKRSRARPWYTVRYQFDVAIRFKGTPSSVPYLITGGVYNDPRDEGHKIYGEQSRFVPGDNVLVVANQDGPVPISWISDCTDSMPWDNQARNLVKRAGLTQAP